MTAPVTSPLDRLSSRVSRLRTRSGASERDRWLLIVGGTLLPLGLLVVVLGWMGMSHTVLLFEQLPYLVSGGILGLSLVIAGGFVYFAYWQTLVVRETRAQNGELREQNEVLKTNQRELVDALGRIEAALSSGPGRAPLRAARPAPPADGMFVTTANGSMLHRPDCSVVAGRESLRQFPAGTAGFAPCGICNPY